MESAVLEGTDGLNTGLSHSGFFFENAIIEILLSCISLYILYIPGCWVFEVLGSESDEESWQVSVKVLLQYITHFTYQISTIHLITKYAAIIIPGGCLG